MNLYSTLIVLLTTFCVFSDTERSPEKRSDTNLRKPVAKQSDYVGSSTDRSNCDSMVGHGRTVSTCKTYLNYIISQKYMCLQSVID